MHIINTTTYADNIFDKGVCTATLQQSRDAILQTISELVQPATNKPTSGHIKAEDPTLLGPRYAAVVSRLQNIQAQQTPVGQISIVLVGETHDFEVDWTRSRDIAVAIDHGLIVPPPGMVIRERDLDYTTPGIVSESELTQSQNYGAPGHRDFGIDSLSRSQRSSVVAGYIAACLAGGNQRSRDLVVLFFGEEHKDIFHEFEYLVDAWTRFGVDWLQKRPRTCYLVRSQKK